MTDFVTTTLILALASAGCATDALWEVQDYHPTDHPDLQLAQDARHNDVLVQYNEQQSKVKKVRRRAYWLFASTNSIAIRGQPVFVDPGNYPGLVAIPLLEEPPDTHPPTPAGFVAVATPAQQGFDLWLRGVWLGRFDLPIYYAKPRATPWRVVATPFAALGDATLVVVVCAAVIAVVVGVLVLDAKTE